MKEVTKTIPAHERETLEELRRIIRAAAPMAEESTRYQIPAYKCYGPLIIFAAFKNHLSFYGVSKSVLKTFSSELEPFNTSGTTIHFSAEHPLPAGLVTKIIRARVEENEARRDTLLQKSRHYPDFPQHRRTYPPFVFSCPESRHYAERNG